MAEINVVPYIDVMLVLLVIFMITAPLLSQGVAVKLPQTESKALSAPQEPIIISVNEQGDYFLNVSNTPDQSIDSNTIITRVAAELELAKQNGQPRPVFVKGDANVSYGNVVQMMALLQKAGVQQVGLLTEPRS